MDFSYIQNQFPILKQEVNRYPLVYLDSAATSLKPKSVIDRIAQHYLMEASNVHRGSHKLSDQATTNYENARSTLHQFLHASSNEEIVFTRSTTESINLIASSFGEIYLQKGDEILITEMEHHSNIVPWQILAQRKKCTLKFIPVNEHGTLDLDQVQKLLNTKTKIFALAFISNTLGTENPIKDLINLGHKVGAKVVIDAAQALAHTQIDIQELGCDFLVGSAHKVFGPTGIGFLCGKKDLLEMMLPYQYGGGMISKVNQHESTYADIPQKFEAGTPHIAGAIGFAQALNFFQSFPYTSVEQHEQELIKQTLDGLENIKSICLIGRPELKGVNRKSIISFIVEGCHHQDIGQLLNNYGIAVRTGHHCTQLLMNRFQIEGTVRISFSLYNTPQNVQHFLTSLEKSIQLLKT